MSEERPPCDCCKTAHEYPDLTRKTYSMGCVYCGARYVQNGGQEIKSWEFYGVTVKEVYKAKAQGLFIDPEVKRRRRK